MMNIPKIYYTNQVNNIYNYKKENKTDKINQNYSTSPSFTGFFPIDALRTRLALALVKSNYKPVVYTAQSGETTHNMEELRQKVEDYKPLYDVLSPGVANETDEADEIQTNNRYRRNNFFLRRMNTDNRRYGKEKFELTDLPHEKTGNRTEFPPIKIPKFKYGKDYSFSLPDTEYEKIVRTNPIDFEPIYEKTVIETDYASSVQWDSDKIARDIMQNFYDGHGQTLDGVKVDFKKQANGKYKVRIEGKSTFDPDKAILFGESTKKDDPRAAGNFGEGLKMTILKLLSDYDVNNCNIGSNNWNVEWSKTKGHLNNKKVLAYDLTKKEQYDGNYFEFETDSEELLSSIANSFDRFYYSGNPDFINPDFENDFMGIKLLPPGEKGSIYISGMEFEFDNEYDNLDGMSVFLKEKPPLKYFNPTRDRHSIAKDDFHGFARFFVEKSSNAEIVDYLKTLEPYWRYNHSYETQVGDELINGVIEGYDTSSRIKIKFPDKYVPVNHSESETNEAKVMSKTGKILCKADFKRIGMKDMKTICLETGKYGAIEPDEYDLKKLALIDEAIKSLAFYLKNEFDTDELNPKIYLGNLGGAGGESIVTGGHCYGMWIDMLNFKTANFSGMLTTVLHELSHKAGGDGDESFTYKLTDVMRCINEAMCQNPALANKFHDMSILWEEINQEQMAGL